MLVCIQWILSPFLRALLVDMCNVRNSFFFSWTGRFLPPGPQVQWDFLSFYNLFPWRSSFPLWSPWVDGPFPGSSFYWASLTSFQGPIFACIPFSCIWAFFLLSPVLLGSFHSLTRVSSWAMGSPHLCETHGLIPWVWAISSIF